MEEVFKIEAEEDFILVVEEVLSSLYRQKNKPFKLIHESSISAAKDEIKDIILKTDLTAKAVFELIITKEKDFPKERSKLFSSIIESKKNELLYATLLNYNSSYGATVVKFDWAIKLVFGTSELRKLKYPLLQLALTTLHNGQQQQQIYDIDKDMLVNIITILESIDTQI